MDKVSASFGEWWMKQAQVDIVHPEVAKWINRNGTSGIVEEGLKSERVVPLMKQNKLKIEGQTTYNGKVIKFGGIKNLETGEIENAYPVIDWGE